MLFDAFHSISMHISSDLNRVQKKCQFIASWGINLMNFFSPYFNHMPNDAMKNDFIASLFSTWVLLCKISHATNSWAKFEGYQTILMWKYAAFIAIWSDAEWQTKTKHTKKSSPPSELIKWWFDKFSCVRLYWYVDWCQTRISAVDSDIKFYDGAYNCTNR